MSWRALVTADGSATLVHPVHGEACHSRAGAWEEAHERYAVPCRIGDRAGEAIRILDIGTGIGLNLAAALEASGGRIQALTLERDASVVEVGLTLVQPPSVMRWLEPVRAALRACLAGAREAPLGSGKLRLVLGDARETLPALESDAVFDAVFLDPFSRRVEPELWDRGFLEDVAARMAPGSLLSTYSASISVRAALYAAGLRVGPGPRVGTKGAGTIASPDAVLPAFDERTRRRIEKRSGDLARTTARGFGEETNTLARLRPDP